MARRCEGAAGGLAGCSGVFLGGGGLSPGFGEGAAEDAGAGDGECDDRTVRLVWRVRSQINVWCTKGLLLAGIDKSICAEHTMKENEVRCSQTT